MKFQAENDADRFRFRWKEKDEALSREVGTPAGHASRHIAYRSFGRTRWRVSSVRHAPGTIYVTSSRVRRAVGQNNRRFHCPRERFEAQTPAGYHYCVDNRELFVIENHHPPPPFNRPLSIALTGCFGNRAISVIRRSSTRVNTAKVAWNEASQRLTDFQVGLLEIHSTL